MFEPRHGEIRQRSVSTNTERTNLQEAAATPNLHRSLGFRTECEKEVYEIQLVQLQEQLESAMIEKEQMAHQLKKYSKPAFRKLQDELEAEKRKNKDLQLMISSKRNSKSLLDSSSDSTSTSDLQGKGSEIRTGQNKKYIEKGSNKTGKSWNFSNRIMERLVRSVYDIAEDFSADSTVDEKEEKEKDGQVNISILKANVKRFGTALKPYINTVKGIQGLLRWQSSSYTLIVFMVYMYAVWMGCAMQVFLLCLIFRHFISYLQNLGITIKFNFFHHEDENESKKEEASLGISDKINLVVQIAKKVQDFLGQAADSLEKIESVLTWRYPPAARRLFTALCGAFIMSLVVDFNILLSIMGFNMGIKLFVIDYVYYKFPKVKRKYDSVYKLWKSLPTRQEWEWTHVQSHIDDCVLPDTNINAQEENTTSGSTNTETSAEPEVADGDREFIKLFCLPPSEIPLSGWRGGRRCSLVNREKKGIGVFKNGKLYLTKSFLCFERTRSPSKENLLIPLVDILAVNKAKPFQLMLGTGMAIEVIVKERSFVFGGMLGRDDAYDSLHEHGINNELPWATGIPLDDLPSPRPKVVRLTENKPNFSFPAEYGDCD